MQPARIGAVRYLNTAPLIEGLDADPKARIEHAVPSRIAAMLTAEDRSETADGWVDVGLVSLLDAANANEPLTLIPAGVIGCEGPTLTVRLFSAVPPDQITTLHADTDSRTSVGLARLILAERYGVSPEIRGFDARERAPHNQAGVTDGEVVHTVDNTVDNSKTPSSEGATLDLAEAWPETVLLIGDKVVSDSPPAVRYPHQLDLGEAWHDLTGLPFVYAAWACRARDADSRLVRTAGLLLDRARRRNAARLDWVIANRAEAKGWPQDLARKYVGELLRYEPDERAQHAAAEFLKRAHALGLCRRSELPWMDLAPAQITAPQDSLAD